MNFGTKSHNTRRHAARLPKVGPAWICSKEKRWRDRGRVIRKLPLIAVALVGTTLIVGLDPSIKGSLLMKQQRVGRPRTHLTNNTKTTRWKLARRSNKKFRYKLTRVAANWLISMFKFRTMDKSVDPNKPSEGQKDAETAHRYVQYARRLSLDELWQVWNVLKGDMALEGPRPLFEVCHQKTIDHIKRREREGLLPGGSADLYQEIVTTAPGGLWGAHYPGCRDYKSQSDDFLDHRFAKAKWYWENGSKEVDKQLARDRREYLRAEFRAIVAEERAYLRAKREPRVRGGR